MVRRVLATAGLMILAIGSVIAISAAWRAITGTRPFDAARWKAERGSDCMRMSRSKMIDDLRASLPRGMSPREVRHLLGKPDYDVGADLSGRGVWWSYLTGPDLVDCSTFDLRFEHGRLEETETGQT